MTPASVLTNFQEEFYADPSLEIQIVYRPEEDTFLVEVDSPTEKRTVQGEAKKIKVALARALGQWNGDGDVV